MPIPVVISYAAAYFSLVVILGVLLRDRHSFVHRTFAAGMLLFAGEELFRALSFGAVLPDDAIYWQKRVIAVSSLLPVVWLAFSLTYARGDVRSTLSRWKWLLAAIGAFPVLFIGIFRQSLYIGAIYLEYSERWSILLSSPGKALSVFMILSSVLILLNLERLVRASTGRMRWQIKFMVLGIAGLFALRIYLGSQTLLYSTVDTGAVTVNGLALIAANLLFAVSLYRGSPLTADVYISTAAIQNSLTIVFAGIYLVGVGVLAHVARSFSSSIPIPLDAFVVFLCLTVLGVLMLSNRLRRKLRLFVSRHFRRPVYDYRNIWMQVTERMTSLLNVNDLCSAGARMVSDSLEILSVSVWLVDDTQRRLALAGSTAHPVAESKRLEKAGKSAPDFIHALAARTGCIDLDDEELSWPAEIMAAAPDFFRQGKMRYAVRLQAGGELVGVMTLNNDRVGHQDLGAEDFVLMETLAAQLAASLLTLRLSARVRHAKEVETFQAVSTFFVHDLKNLASRLSLTMQNLPANFDNPEFRSDALRVMSASVKKIDGMCERLSMLKESIDLKPAECDLTELIAAALDDFKPNLKAELKQDLQPLPKIRIDSEQIQKVLTNLVLNANEAVNGNGVIQISTVHEGNMAGFSVRDNGCGMSEEFIEKSLFKPFQTTKKKGLGIGLFHTKLIVEAHRGMLEVNSAVGAGTEFRVILPITN
jgi:putative PEP-CTERM system histidine kinase